LIGYGEKKLDKIGFKRTRGTLPVFQHPLDVDPLYFHHILELYLGERKKGRKEERKEERKEGRKEGRQEGRQEGRKEIRKE
jgi:hypothetical protein